MDYLKNQQKKTYKTTFLHKISQEETQMKKP